jgi:hypothetical protein
MKIVNIFKYARPVLAYLVVLLSFGFLYCLAFIKIPPDNKDTVNLCAGLVLGVLAVVIGYYFGTSKDKSDQDQSKIFPKDGTNQ